MEPYRQRRLGGVGEGLWVIERTQPLTQLRLTSYAFGFGGKSAQPSPTGEGLPLNPRKIRNLANRVTEPCQQSHPKRPFFRVWIIHHHAVKKRVNGCA
jgi:hypothetical protein